MIYWLHKRPLLRFILAVLALLPACFLCWYFVGDFIAAPAVLVVEPLLQNWLGESIASISFGDTGLFILTKYGELDGRILPAAQAGNQLGYPINTRILSYSIPFFTALHLATPMPRSWENFSWCLLCLWGLLAIGLVSTALKELMLGIGATFMNTERVPPGNLIAVMYQFSTLMVPPLAPVLLWAYTAKDSPAFIGLLPDSLKPAQDKDSNI